MDAPRDRPPTADSDLELAYRLVLNRDPDPEGRRHYRELIARGMSFRALVDALLASPEYGAGEPAPAGAPRRDDAIDPRDVIARCSLDDLIETADAYYRGIADPTPLMARPFAYLHEAPVMLQSLGALLAGIQLGKGMRVLDFGAGSGWISLALAQLECEPICCDVSAAALAIARRLFAERPPIGPDTPAPSFVQFDGRSIPLETESVDRVVCFDALHHVPNVGAVLGELGRVLRAGGIAGFSEPGRHHSRSTQAQTEMRDHRVLENDVDLFAIADASRAGGFTRLTVRLQNNLEVSLEDYGAIVEGRRGAVRHAVWNDVRETLISRAVFFLHKGETRRDSRSHVGLAHAIRTPPHDRIVRPGANLALDLDIANTGQATWLSAHASPAGVVRVGTHLYDANGALVALDHSRHDLPHDVRPGESIRMSIEVPLPPEGDWRLVVDLVAERVIWFEHVGSTPLAVRVRR